jgi:hypothetical protein
MQFRTFTSEAFVSAEEKIDRPFVVGRAAFSGPVNCNWATSPEQRSFANGFGLIEIGIARDWRAEHFGFQRDGILG